MARTKRQFDKRNVKISWLSANPIANHAKSATDGAAPSCPMIGSLQLTAKHKVATPVQWRQGDDVIIADSVPMRTPRKPTRMAGRRRNPTSASCHSRRHERLGYMGQCEVLGPARSGPVPR